jgi:radical SAM protein with 4Fe4S-binding SPASM domain
MLKHSNNDHFCILPWIHLHVSQNGRVSPCCNNNRYLGNVQETSIEEIWNGDKFEELREQFKNGKADKRCNHCYNIEASGKKSMRQISNEKYASEIDSINNINPQPIYLDIRFSNICNFKCKTCWHGNSSAWYEEGSNKNAGNERIIKAFTNNFEELLPYLDNVKEIYFAGGEPLIMEEHYQVLDELISRQLFDVELRYNTNFSNLHFKDKSILEIWKKFKNVHVSASIDAAFNLGEKIRGGFDWKLFVANREQMIKVCPEVYFEVTPTVSTLNILNLSELHQELVNQNLIGLDNIYLNFLERPKEFNVKSIADGDKICVKNNLINHIDWLTDKDAGTAIVTQFKNLLNYTDIC